MRRKTVIKIFSSTVYHRCIKKYRLNCNLADVETTLRKKYRNVVIRILQIHVFIAERTRQKNAKKISVPRTTPTRLKEITRRIIQTLYAIPRRHDHIINPQYNGGYFYIAPLMFVNSIIEPYTGEPTNGIKRKAFNKILSIQWKLLVGLF